MASYTHHCRIQHTYPVQGSEMPYQGPQCFMLKHATCITRNHQPLPAMCPEPCAIKCEAPATELCAPKSPSPCDTKSSEPSEEKCVASCIKPCHELYTIKNPLPPSMERFNMPYPPPNYMQPCAPRYPPLCSPNFGMPQTFPSSSQLFPPRKMYQYTARKTYKSCYAK